MTTHRRAWMQRAGVVVALAASALLASPAPPASAEDPTVSIVNLSAGTINSGQQATLQYSVTNNNTAPPLPASFRIEVTVFNGLSCSGDCDVQRLIGPGESATFTARLTGGNVPAGETRSGQIRITAEAGGDSGSASRNMTVRGPDKPQVQTVKEISGRVTDQSTGDPISGATVMIQDTQNHTYQTTSNGSGNFRFTGSEQKPISPGRISLGAIKDGVTRTGEINANANQVISGQRIVLAVSAAATPSAEPSEEASEEPPLESEAPEESASAAAEVPQAVSDEGSGGMGSWLLIILGGLLVALGVGAIVLLLMRRKENADEDADGAAAGAAGRPRAAAPASGVYGGAADQTRIAGMPGGGPADATMVHNPGLADAPTMMHNRPLVDDEFPDPYGAPLPPQPPGGPQAPPTYGGQGGRGDDGYGRGGPPSQPGYGAGPGGGYGNAPSSGSGYGNAPSPSGGYGAGPGGGYGNAPSSGSGYGNAPSSGSGYGGGPGGYGAGYGNAPASGGGYGNAPSSGGGYGNAPSSGSGYGPPGPRDGEGSYGGRGYGGQPDGPPTAAYPPPSGGGYGERYDEPTGRYTGPDPGAAPGYGNPAGPYESGSYDTSGPGRHGAEPYGQEAEYGRPGSGGYGAGQGYDGPAAGGGYGGEYGGGAGGGYGQSGYGSGGGYDQRQGYEGSGGGYGRVPEQSSGGPGGYGGQGYEQQGGYYGGRDQGDERSAPPPQQGRSERRSLDWLDD